MVNHQLTITMSMNATDGKAEIAKFFLENVQTFAIHSCILGVVMLLGTYISIILFNIAAHSQVR